MTGVWLASVLPGRLVIEGHGGLQPEAVSPSDSGHPIAAPGPPSSRGAWTPTIEDRVARHDPARGDRSTRFQHQQFALVRSSR